MLSVVKQGKSPYCFRKTCVYGFSETWNPKFAADLQPVSYSVRESETSLGKGM